jgi:hypothetical protein
MAILDDVLAGLVDGLKTDLADAGLVRVRGGLARGVAWAEASGRAAAVSCGERRVHHRPAVNRLQAGLLAYPPLSRGGRTVVVGEQSLTYQYEPIEVSLDLLEEVSAWLRRVAMENQATAIGAASGF